MTSTSFVLNSPGGSTAPGFLVEQDYLWFSYGCSAKHLSIPAQEDALWVAAEQITASVGHFT